MLLGQKLQNSLKNVGNKQNAQYFIGNKINSQHARRHLPLAPHNVALKHSPIEKPHINNH